MCEPHAATEGRHEPGMYEIRLKGHLHTRWTERFVGMSLTHASDGTTVLIGPVIDQAALYGVLRHVRDLGLPLISVIAVDPGDAERPQGDTVPDHTNKEPNV